MAEENKMKRRRRLLAGLLAMGPTRARGARLLAPRDAKDCPAPHACSAWSARAWSRRVGALGRWSSERLFAGSLVRTNDGWQELENEFLNYKKIIN